MSDSFNRALAPVFAGDMPATLSRLSALAEEGLTPKDRAVRACIRARFAGTAADDPREAAWPEPVRAVLGAYRRYWSASLMKRVAPEEAQARLSADLAPWAGPAATDLTARAEAVRGVMAAQGFQSLGGVTPPLHELMLWRRQRTTAERVPLPDGDIDVKVTLLDDFASLGWAAWGTCDSRHTGGWTTDEGIMVVAPAWKLDSEAYRISLLAHEAQHFSDRARYPQLSAADLEYRAKLVELALASDSQAGLWQKFSIEARRERALPHPYASHWVVERLRARLGQDCSRGCPTQAVRDAALAELAAHAAALDAAGRATVQTALPD
jgi:hypothetical protein